MCSYFWNSDIHLYYLRLSIEIIGALFEIGIAFGGWLTLRKEISELRQKTLERLFEAVAVIAAVIVLIVVILNVRLDALQESATNNKIATAVSPVTNALAIATNEVNSLSNKLELATGPRMLTEEQKMRFELWTRGIAKVPITIYASPRGDDTESFALQLRDMFTKAHFTVPANADSDGINRDVPIRLGRRMAGSDRPPTVMFIHYGAPGVSNSVEVMNVELEPIGNGEFRPRVGTNDLFVLYTAIGSCLEKVGISTGWIDSTSMVTPGQYIIVVPPKTM
jgi:hypothetical protein